MKHSVIKNSSLLKSMRIDPKYYIDEGNAAHYRITYGNWDKIRLGELLGDESVWVPPRFTQIQAYSPIYGKPYLAPWDTLRYVFNSNVYLSSTQNRHFNLCELKRGWLLITCSGRNLGPCVFVDDVLSRYVVSGDMIRISVTDNDDIFYVMAFLHTPTGQSLIRRNKSGSVIDHISPKNVRDLLIPILNKPLKNEIIKAFKNAAILRENARLSLIEAQKQFYEATKLIQLKESLNKHDTNRRFSINVSCINDRIDAEPYAPLYKIYRDFLMELKIGVPLGQIADSSRPPGRYRTLYVQDENYGIPILSGRQFAQFRPVGLKYIAKGFKHIDKYLLTSNTIVLAADGRSEENLADCAMILDDREGWAASGHVIRYKAKKRRKYRSSLFGFNKLPC